MLRAGHRVALAGRGEAALHATACAAAPGPVASGTGASGQALVVPADVRSAASVGALFAAVAARWGRVDVLVNNAGTFGHGGPLDVVPLEQWNAVIETNLTGSFLCAQRPGLAPRPRAGTATAPGTWRRPLRASARSSRLPLGHGRPCGPHVRHEVSTHVPPG